VPTACECTTGMGTSPDVGTEHQGIAEGGHDEAPSLLATASAASWRALALAGGAGLALGLLVGVPIGRATIDAPDSPPVEAARPAPLVESEVEATPAAPEPVPQAYRASFLHRVPKGTKGVRRETTDEGRRTARLEGEAANLRVAFQPVAGEAYALSAIVRLEGARAGKLQTAWDGQALGTWDLTGDWALVSTPIAPSALVGEKHDVRLAPSALPVDAVVRLDSVAVLPVGDELHFAAHTESAGHLIEGFAIPESRFVWSNGPRSVIGGVLAPAAGPYELTVLGSAYSHIAPIDVRLSVNGKSIGSAAVTKKSEDIVWEIPSGALRAGPNQFAFEYSKTGQPSKLKPGSKDDRSLAMRFVSVSLAPRD